MIDTQSFAFGGYPNPHPGYYTPTPGGTNTVFHNQAGDLHSVGIGIGIPTPLSQPSTEDALHGGQPVAHPMSAFPHPIDPHQYPQNSEGFDLSQQHQAFAAPTFPHQADIYDPDTAIKDDSPSANLALDAEVQDHSPILTFPIQPLERHMHPPVMRQLQDRYVSLMFHLVYFTVVLRKTFD